MNSKKIILSVAVLYFSFSGAQQTAFFQDKNAFKTDLASQNFDAKLYEASHFEFANQFHYNHDLEPMQKEASRFYENLTATVLGKNHAEEGLQKFVEDYPNSVYFSQAGLPLADYFLAKKEFAKALEILEKKDVSKLSGAEKSDYQIKLGYAKFMQGDTDGAMNALENAYNSASEPEKSDVAYMLGHLNYAKSNYSDAFKYFDEIKNSEKYQKVVKPYYVQLYYNQKNYDEAISAGNALLNDDLSEDYKSEVHKIIGESYFIKQDYSNANSHLKYYLDHQNQPTEKDLYEMGFVSAKNKDYNSAVSYYNQLVNTNSELAQNAYYQLGNAYLQTGKKQEALSAFRSAYQMDYDADVKKLALSQYAKIGYEIGNPFESPANVIQEYLKKYPNADNRQEMRSLLMKSYLYSGNYRETLEAIDQNPQKNSETDKIDHEVSFLLGTEEFNKGNFDEAEKYFTRSLKNGGTDETFYRANYWLGQTFYQKKNYSGAISQYEKIFQDNVKFPEKQQLPYDLGYAYFKDKNFEKAQQYFQQYLQNPKPEFAEDANLRLADTYYADNKLAEAISIYDKAQNVTDYILYQKAMAQGFKGDNSAKISGLKSLISKYPNSEYVDDANFELGAVYASQDDFSASNSYFDKVISQNSDADLAANAKIYKAQNLFESGKNDEAIAEFRRLGNEFAGITLREKIVQASQPAFLKNDDLQGYRDFAKNLGVSLEDEKINTTYVMQGSQYFSEKNYEKAIPILEGYLENHREVSEWNYMLKYQLGESYYQTGNSTKALLTLQEVAGVTNEYQEDAQVRISQILIASNQKSEAKNYLEKLINSTDSSVKSFAENELLKIYSDEKNYANAEKMADRILANSKNSPASVESAKVVKARIYMQNGKDKDAQKAYSALEKSTNSAVAAEALYAKAFYQNQAKAYKSSNETIFKLANNYSSEQFWGAKALIVMAKNYYGLKDKYQATYTLDQIIENYKEYPDLVAEAKEFKTKIK